MTHTREMKDSEGTFGPEQPTFHRCRKCKSDGCIVQAWESNDGAYEDYRYRCTAPGCGHVWWIDGPDS